MAAAGSPRKSNAAAIDEARCIGHWLPLRCCMEIPRELSASPCLRGRRLVRLSISKTAQSCKIPCQTEVSGVSDKPSECVSFRSGELSAEVSPLGAQLYALRDGTGRDLMWSGDPSVWSGRAPLLFPIVGVLAGGSYRLGDRVFHLSRHGFARGRVFELVESGKDAATFRLKFDAASLLVYPFRFELEVRFALDGPTLSVT